MVFQHTINRGLLSPTNEGKKTQTAQLSLAHPRGKRLIHDISGETAYVSLIPFKIGIQRTNGLSASAFNLQAEIISHCTCFSSETLNLLSAFLGISLCFLQRSERLTHVSMLCGACGTHKDLQLLLQHCRPVSASTSMSPPDVPRDAALFPFSDLPPSSF